jgi:hypothetical protein
MAARRKTGEGTDGGADGAGTGLGYPVGVGARVAVVAGDTWQVASRECLVTALRRLEELAGGSQDVGELLRVVAAVSDVVATAEDV